MHACKKNIEFGTSPFCVWRDNEEIQQHVGAGGYWASFAVIVGLAMATFSYKERPIVERTRRFAMEPWTEPSATLKQLSTEDDSMKRCKVRSPSKKISKWNLWNFDESYLLECCLRFFLCQVAAHSFRSVFFHEIFDFCNKRESFGRMVFWKLHSWRFAKNSLKNFSHKNSNF